MHSVLRAPLSTIQAHFPLPERVVSPVISHWFQMEQSTGEPHWANSVALSELFSQH